jgi:hypothetical protein
MKSVTNLFKKVPLPIWALLCLAVAIFYIIVWPSANNPGDAGSLRYIILRWFHSLAWLFLAASCFLRMSSAPKLLALAKVAAFLALPTYILFFMTTSFAAFLA